VIFQPEWFTKLFKGKNALARTGGWICQKRVMVLLSLLADGLR